MACRMKMMTEYKVAVNANMSKILKKLKKKNRQLYDAILKKASEISVESHRYKNLRHDKSGLSRVHIDPFVLTFSIDDESKTVLLKDFDHHDLIYKK
jgi:mRNA-degrading endonuclease RelE of RelBE toxin-antitoxin system